MLLSGGGDSRLSCGNKTDTWDVEQVQVEAFAHKNMVSACLSSLGCFHIDDDDPSAPTLFICCCFFNITLIVTSDKASLLLQVVAIAKPSLFQQYSLKWHVLYILYLQDKPFVHFVLHFYIWVGEYSVLSQMTSPQL